MKVNSIISRYIFKEIITPFVIILIFFTFIFLMTKLIDITNLIVNYRIGISSVFMMLVYTTPYFLVFVIPMSVMMAVLLTFLRLSSDNEILALKAGGINMYGMLPPVFFFSLIGFILTGFMIIYGLPWGRIALKEEAFKMAASNMNIGLKERTFNGSFKNIMLYINKIDTKNNMLTDIFIEDQRTGGVAVTIVAPKGELLSDPDTSAFQLKLFNGTISQVNLKKKEANSINFDIYEIRLDMEQTFSKTKNDSEKSAKEMSLNELREYLKSDTKRDTAYYSALIEFHRKFSIPSACFILGFLAIPLGIQSRTARRSFGIGIGLFFILLYYLMLSAGEVFGETGLYPPIIGMWVPNIAMGIIGLYFFRKAEDDRPILFFIRKK